VGLRYGGLNHLGWFWPASPQGEVLLAAATARGVIDADPGSASGLHRYATISRSSTHPPQPGWAWCGDPDGRSN
jgi:hypothetical protein